MSERKVHYNPKRALVVEEVSRVAMYCGAVTHGTRSRIFDREYDQPEQAMVRETRAEDKVTCRNCLARIDRDL